MADAKTAFGKKVVVTAHEEGLGGVILEIEKGKKTDMVFHVSVKKLLYVVMGKLFITVLADGKMAKVEAVAGSSFAVREGLAYQLEGAEKSIVVEFSNGWLPKDVHCISKGSVEETPTVEAPVEQKPPAPADQAVKEAQIQQRPKGKGKKKKK
jgi:hypothetical protein